LRRTDVAGRGRRFSLYLRPSDISSLNLPVTSTYRFTGPCCRRVACVLKKLCSYQLLTDFEFFHTHSIHTRTFLGFSGQAHGSVTTFSPQHVLPFIHTQCCARAHAVRLRRLLLLVPPGWFAHHVSTPHFKRRCAACDNPWQPVSINPFRPPFRKAQHFIVRMSKPCEAAAGPSCSATSVEEEQSPYALHARGEIDDFLLSRNPVQRAVLLSPRDSRHGCARAAAGAAAARKRSAKGEPTCGG
jgi:hypothetical protein